MMTQTTNNSVFPLLYIVLGSVAGVLILIALIIFIVLLASKKKKVRLSNEAANRRVEESAKEVSSCFGGKENILSVTQQGSRVTLVRKDPSLADKEKINACFKDCRYRGNKIVFIIGSKSEEFKKLLEENRK